MGVIKRNCPHCETKSIAFIAISAVRKHDTNIWLTSFKCNGCHGGYFVEIKSNSGVSPKDHQGDIESDRHFNTTREYPRKVETNIPEHLPNNINNFFSQAISSLRSENFDSSAMMSRKVLEVSVKNIHPESTGSLYRRIEALEAEGLITGALKEWAHIIREDGNESAHEEEPVTREFAEEILSFTELFLLYVFTMPGMVNERMPQSEEV
ncbi:DUF4145 domain-containing protein [Pseudoalteromonas fuliginea]|uniref:DUF4145 domain-containing protein n=1 Tax=Pseudoalteromonas fuliginea TaxID=1872678 RepID=A0ABD3Y9L2_9GAMM|nr:DUF4145 domain-containing protein [Pseudoalteromonas fuliginea]KDC51031.1 hypothetical protein DC53_10855 [Pseudoalteromonas fuliginea]